ncbi:MAG TPA: phosphatase PAP2 family protein [Gaiellales bacterium]|nr:phosphatase PAP2 family protein [Gaiellales bacterium]
MGIQEHHRVSPGERETTAVERRGRPDVPVLEPRPGGIATHAGRRMSGHPVIAFVVVTLIGFALLSACAVLAGWLLKTYALPEHGFGHADEHVNVVLARHRSGLGNDASYWLSGIGDIFAIPAIVAITAIVAMVLRKWRVAAFIVAAIAVEAATYRVTTLLIHRDRPHVHRLDDLPVNASYYSGHTAASVAVYCGVGLLISWKLRSGWLKAAVWLVAIAVPLLVAASRMYRGMHHPTDVAAGLLIGIGTLIVAVAAARAAKAAEGAPR